MNTFLYRRQALPCAALLLALAASSPAQADLVAPAEPSVFALPTETLLAVGASSSGAADERQFVLAADGPASTLASASLWAFITSARAQQRGDMFVRLESNLLLIQATETPSPVPLPGALWLLVMGLLGLAGVKLGGHAPAAARLGAPASGGAVPSLT